MSRRNPEPCSLCLKAPKDGCSHVDCPSRKPVTAAQRGVPAGITSGQRAYEPNRFENQK